MNAGLPRPLWRITVANFLFFLSVTSFFTLPVHLEALGASRAEVGRVMGSFGIASLLAIPLTGLLADRLGRRPFLILGALLWAAGALGFSQVTALGQSMYALRLLHGVAFSCVFVATNAVVADLAPRGQLGRAIAVFGTTTLAAHALGPSLGELVIARWDFYGLFLGSAGLALLSLGVFATLGESRGPVVRESAPLSWLALSFRAGARGVLLASFAAAIAFGAAIHFMSVFVRAREIGSHSPFFLAYVVAAIAVRLLAGGLGDRVGHRRVGTWAAVAFAFSVIGLGFVHEVWTLIIAGLGFGAAHGLAYPSLNALFVEGAGPNARGRAMASFNLSFNVGMTVSAFVAGEVAERYGYTAMWLLTGCCALFGALGVAGRARATDRA